MAQSDKAVPADKSMPPAMMMMVIPKAATTTVRNVAEYLGHERQDLVPRSEAEQFLQGVDTLREDVDRLAARVDLLTRQ